MGSAEPSSERSGTRQSESRRSLCQTSPAMRTRCLLQNHLGYYAPQSAVRDACCRAGLDDATAARFHEMAFYATYAVDALVRKSGQSAFTWVPLQGVTQCALNSVPEAEKPAFTQSFIGALTGVSQPLQSLLMRKDTDLLGSDSSILCGDRCTAYEVAMPPLSLCFKNH